MSTFDFFNSFFGLVLGLSVTVMATGLASSIQHRRTIRIGWLTPFLALFVGLDIAGFWGSAWGNFQNLPFSYGLLVTGLLIALVYFIAASLVFPHKIEAGMSLDDHFWENKKVVLLLISAANILLLLMNIVLNISRPGSYEVGIGVLVVLSIPAAFTRRRLLFAGLIGLYIVIYLLIAVVSVVAPDTSSMASPSTATSPEPIG